MEKAFVIAEAGVNHNGSRDLALQLIDVAVTAQADAVKFQTFKAAKLVTASARKAEYQIANEGGQTESQFAMLERLELKDTYHRDLSDYARSKGIKFMSTAFDRDSLAFLVEEIGVDLLKIPSGEITNGPLLLEYAKYGLPIVLSTGMSTLVEVERALKALLYGFANPKRRPENLDEIEGHYRSVGSYEPLKGKVTVLHCTTEYPAPLAEVNLLAMETLGRTFDLPYGYSDHTEGIFVSVAAAARGAKILEKHFTLDRTLPGPDHKASLEPAELIEMVRQIRLVELVLGRPEKMVQHSEVKNREIARRSLVAGDAIKSGDLFSENNLIVVRPEGGADPFRYWEFLGQKATRDYSPGDFIL